MGLMPALVAAQAAGLGIRVDALPSLSVDERGRVSVKWYDAMGRHSTVGLTLDLDTGWRLVVRERLQRIPNDPDAELLDQGYIEDPGNWRIGKQYLPFGGSLLRTAAPAARIDTQLLIDDLPIAIALADAGSGDVRAVVARVGRGIGVSFARGNHLGIAGTSLTAVRGPEASPGPGRGYRQVVGFDTSRRWGKWRVELEGVALRDPERDLDPLDDVSDVRVTYSPRFGSRVTGAWSREWRARRNAARLEGEVELNRQLGLEMVAWVGERGQSRLSFSARIKL